MLPWKRQLLSDKSCTKRKIIVDKVKVTQNLKVIFTHTHAQRLGSADDDDFSNRGIKVSHSHFVINVKDESPCDCNMHRPQWNTTSYECIYLIWKYYQQLLVYEYTVESQFFKHSDFFNHGTFPLNLLQSNTIILTPIFWSLDFSKLPIFWSNSCLP